MDHSVKRAWSKKMLLSIILMWLVNLTASAQVQYVETVKVNDHIYVFKPRLNWTDGNSIAIIGKNGIFLIDTPRPNYTEEIVKRLKTITPLPIKYLLNTHWHNDHILGNATVKSFYPECQIIGQNLNYVEMPRNQAVIDGEPDGTKKEMERYATELKNGKRTNGTPLTEDQKTFWAALIEDSQDYLDHYKPMKLVNADITFGDSLAIQWENMPIQLLHAGDAHSKGDAMVWLPAEKILITGDIVVHPTPYAIGPNDAGVIAALQKVVDMNPSLIIPGHGDVLRDLSYVKLVKELFVAMNRLAEAAIAKKIPVKEALDTASLGVLEEQVTGSSDLKKWAYKSFFLRSGIYNIYNRKGALVQ